MQLISASRARALSCALFLWVGCGDSGARDTSRDAGTEGAPGPRIFVSVSATNEVLVLDDATHEQRASIAVGMGPAVLVATPDRAKLYSANWGDNSISAIDTGTLSAAPIGLPGRPYVIAMAPGGERLYAGLDTTNAIAVIDTATDSVLKMFPMSELPASIVVSADGASLYVATLGSVIPGFGDPGSLMAISAEDGSMVHDPVAVGSVPAWITMSPDGRDVYTLNFLSDDISVVDTESWTLKTTISTGTGSQAIIGHVTPDSTTLYVTNFGTAELVAIDTTSYAITQTIPLLGKPVGVDFSPDGQRVYVTDFGPDSLDQSPLIGLNYLLMGVYTGTGAGQVSVFEVATGDAVGTTVQTGPGATSVIVSGPLP